MLAGNMKEMFHLLSSNYDNNTRLVRVVAYQIANAMYPYSCHRKNKNCETSHCAALYY